MISKTTPQFWQRYASLPPDVRRLADKAYALWINDPNHGSLHFKKLAGHEGLWSVRIGRQYRALAQRRDDLRMPPRPRAIRSQIFARANVVGDRGERATF